MLYKAKEVRLIDGLCVKRTQKLKQWINNLQMVLSFCHDAGYKWKIKRSFCNVLIFGLKIKC